MDSLPRCHRLTSVHEAHLDYADTSEDNRLYPTVHSLRKRNILWQRLFSFSILSKNYPRLVLHFSIVSIKKEPDAAGTTNVSTPEGEAGKMVWGRSEWMTMTVRREERECHIRPDITLIHSHTNDVHLNKDTTKLSPCTLRRHGEVEARFHTFLTSTLVAVGGLIHAPAALPPAAIDQKAGWAPEPVS